MTATNSSFNTSNNFRVVSRSSSRRFHPKSRQLFPFYFSNIMLKADLLTFRVTGTVFKIASEMRRLPAHSDNPVTCTHMNLLSVENWVIIQEGTGLKITAGQRTMSCLIEALTGQTFDLPVMLTGQN